MITSLNQLQANTNRQLYILIDSNCVNLEHVFKITVLMVNNAPPRSCQPEAASHPVGQNLELVDTNDAITVQPASLDDHHPTLLILSPTKYHSTGRTLRRGESM